jgi:hypothetical protein
MTPTFFRSGLSSPQDFRAAMLAKVPAGVSTDRVSAAMMGVIEAYLLFGGGKVFVDSGAFGFFRRGEAMDERDFEAHLAFCERLAGRIAERPAGVEGFFAREAYAGCLRVVAPDVIGDQDATVGLLTKYSTRLTKLAQHAVVIVPLQKGRLSLSTFFARVTALLGTHNICAGLPFNAAALGVDETLMFLAEAAPARAHFLGASHSKRFQSILAEAVQISPETEFSFDSAVVRSICDAIIADTLDSLEAAHCELVERMEAVATERSPLVCRDYATTAAAADVLRCSTDDVVAAIDAYESGQLGNLDDGCPSDLLGRLAWTMLNDQAFDHAYLAAVTRAEFGLKIPRTRAAALAAHPKFARDPLPSAQATLRLVA